MPRPVWPPEYVNVPIDALLDEKLSHGAFRFYARLRALAWGEESLTINFGSLMKLTGLSDTRGYEYARLLRDHRKLLSYSVRNSVFECSFPSAAPIPEFREDPNQSLSSVSPLKTKTKPPKKDVTVTGAGTRAIQAEYERLLGYELDDWAAGEAKAAKWIGERYSTEDMAATYQYHKAKPFWADQRLFLRQLKSLIPEFPKNGKHPHSAVGQMLAHIEQLEKDNHVQPD